ncbi:SIR2 family NAD-dependent protein deacylase [Clostridium sp. DL1XJH146]
MKNVFQKKDKRIDEDINIENTISNSGDKYERIKNLIKEADAVVIGAGAGFSTAAGLEYSGDRFTDNFKKFIDKYGMTDMYSAAFYPFNTQEEKWGYWSKHILMNRYQFKENGVYKKFKELVADKEYFVLTTNVDHLFYKAGFDESRIFATQGDYGLFQCSKACHNKLYSNEDIVYEMIEKEKDCRIPSELVPKCPVCGENMAVNVRADDSFVQDENWDKALDNYKKFLSNHKKEKVVFIELGVGMNTPVIIKYPFWQMTNLWEGASFVCINKGMAYAPDEIMPKSICVDAEISIAINKILE